MWAKTEEGVVGGVRGVDAPLEVGDALESSLLCRLLVCSGMNCGVDRSGEVVALLGCSA